MSKSVFILCWIERIHTSEIIIKYIQMEQTVFQFSSITYFTDICVLVSPIVVNRNTLELITDARSME